MTKHYDVVVLGAGTGALVTAALLARRSWRVLVVGQGHRPPRYGFEDLSLARRAFTLLYAGSPAWTRVVGELAQTQTWRRKTRNLDPMFQVLGRGLRLEFPPDQELFAQELDREFPEIRRAADELYGELARINGEADAAFELDVVWPPGTFWERRETHRVLSDLPLATEPARDLLIDFPPTHPYRRLVLETARHASDATILPPFAVARLHGSYTRGIAAVLRGELEVSEFLLDRIRAHGGDVRLGDRVVSIIQRGGKVRAVELDGQDEPVGVTFVVSGGTTEELLRLAPSFPVPRKIMDSLPSLSADEHRYCVSLVVRDEGLPPPLATLSFLLGEPSGRELSLHLQKAEGPFPGTTLLVVEALLSAGAPKLGRAREAVLATLSANLPFFERHALVCDSPHDGRPLWDYRSGTRKDQDRVLVRAAGGSLEPEPMVPRYRVVGGQLHGLAAESLRTPLGGAFVCGRTVLPTLGQEGELLAAWSVARIITRTDSKKEKMRREMWSKVEVS